jgi:hypothetical protein
MKRLVIAGLLVAMVLFGLSVVSTWAGQTAAVTCVDCGGSPLQPVWLTSDDPNDPNDPNDSGTTAPE